jgi:hypothetical protein
MEQFCNQNKGDQSLPLIIPQGYVKVNCITEIHTAIPTILSKKCQVSNPTESKKKKKKKKKNGLEIRKPILVPF